MWAPHRRLAKTIKILHVGRVFVKALPIRTRNSTTLHFRKQILTRIKIHCGLTTCACVCVCSSGVQVGFSTVGFTLGRKPAVPNSTWRTTWCSTRSSPSSHTTSRWRCAATSSRWSWRSPCLRPTPTRAKSESEEKILSKRHVAKYSSATSSESVRRFHRNHNPGHRPHLSHTFLTLHRSSTCFTKIQQ